MLNRSLLVVAAAAALFVASSNQADAGSPWSYTNRWAQQAASTYPWHGGYQNMQYQAPVALVVPPTAHMRTQYSWGVSQNLMYPIHHQFGYDAPASGGLGGFRNTPPWPSHTSQFGVYYVRGPW
jgi:hypothetical protein